MSIVESIMLTDTSFVPLFLHPNVKQIIKKNDQPFTSKIVVFV